MFSQIIHLIDKEYRLEFKNKSALNSVLLYTISVAFICYLSFGQGFVEPKVWVVLYWLMITFSAFNAVAKSFLQESDYRTIYYFSVAHPIAIISSKMIYNSALMLLVSFMGFLVFALTLDNPIEDHGVFIAAITLGSIGFSAILTFLSGVASRVGTNQNMILSILGLPLILPLILLLIKMSKGAIDPFLYQSFTNDLLILTSIDCIVVMLSVILFPYLWRG